MGVDFVALSFVSTGRTPRSSTTPWRNSVERADHCKIERRRPWNTSTTSQAFDGVMVARGDLGVEIGAERVPLIQKRIIRKATELMKPVITATQISSRW